MELIIQILMLFICINTSFKLSFWKWWQTMLFGLVCAVFIILSCQYAILQSKTQLADYLTNSTILQNIAVLITAESVLCFAFCFIALQKLFGEKVKSWMKPLYGYPSLLIFPVLFYLLTQSIFSMSGMSFTSISYLLAAAVFVTIPILSYLIKWLYPEKELRLEVHFLVSLFVSIIGLITTVNQNVTYNATQDPINIKAIIISGSLFLSLFLVGMLWNKVKWSIISKKNKN